MTLAKNIEFELVKGKSKRGFASMDKEKQRKISSKGGKSAHVKGTAHEWTTEEARLAGQKGGLKVSRNREHMERIGKLGGVSRWKKERNGRNIEVSLTGQSKNDNQS